MMDSDTISTFFFFLNVFLKLGLVLILIYSGAFYLRRRQNNAHHINKKQIQVLETAHLNPHRTLHLVKVGNQTYLIGATDHNIHLLSQMESSDVLAEKSDVVPATSLPLPDFATFFLRSLNKIKARP